MEFSNGKESSNRKIEMTGMNSDSWFGRWPLEDITNYLEYLVAVDEVTAAMTSLNSMSPSKENCAGESFGDGVGERVSKSGAEEIHVKDKGDLLRKGFR